MRAIQPNVGFELFRFGARRTGNQPKRFRKMASFSAGKANRPPDQDYQRKEKEPASSVGSNRNIQLIITCDAAKLASKRMRFEIVDIDRPGTAIVVRRLFNPRRRAEIGSGPITKRSVGIAPGTGGGGDD